MLKVFRFSTQLKTTYLINGFLYYLRNIPLINKLIPTTLHDNKLLKSILTFLSYVFFLGKSLLFKPLYVFFLFYLPLTSISTLTTQNICNTLLFMALAGGIVNTLIFNPSIDKYYGVVLLKLDAKKYILSNYFYAIFEMFFGYIAGLFITSQLFNVNLFPTSSSTFYFSILFPIFTFVIKNCFISYKLTNFKKTGRINSENNLSSREWIIVSLCIILAYGLPFFSLSLPLPLYTILGTIFLVFNIFALKKMITFDDYAYLTKLLYNNNGANFLDMKNDRQKLMASTYNKQIDASELITSNKNGYDFFHELFMKRHHRVLTSMTRKITIALLALAVISIFLASTNDNFKILAHTSILNSTPFLLLVMLYLNRGSTITQTMFINCDYSLLSYNFYKKPDTILQIFKRRLKSLVLINLPPTLIIAITLPVLLYLSGGIDNPWNYFILFLEVIAISIFYSTFYLVLYYLLQPFQKGLQVKNPLYYIFTSIVFFLSFQLANTSLPLAYFGIFTIIFTTGYVFISTFLIYKFAPCTFKLK